MHRLTREIRFAVNATEDDQLAHAPTNSYGGYPSLTGLGYFFTLAATVEGPLDPDSNYLLNIKQIDAVLRASAVPIIIRHVRTGTFGGGGHVLREVYEALGGRETPRHERSEARSEDQAEGQTAEGARSSAPLSPSSTTSCLPASAPSCLPPTRLTLHLSPFQSWSILASELPMIRLSQMFEFAATHRLHNPALSQAENRSIYGKCNNPHGHGHNYQLQVTLVGTPDANGVLMNIPRFEQVVVETVIDRFDHKNLNVELAEFAERIPSVENIAQVIYRLLQPRLQLGHARLAGVTVWETPKTWCEYAED